MLTLTGSRKQLCNGVTRRDLQLAAREQGRPWDWGKAFDQSAVISPLVPINRVASLDAAQAALAAHGVVITEGPVRLGGALSLFLRDPDRNVIELREG